jgi:hypothetical protein
MFYFFSVSEKNLSDFFSVLVLSKFFRNLRTNQNPNTLKIQIQLLLFNKPN